MLQRQDGIRFACTRAALALMAIALRVSAASAAPPRFDGPFEVRQFAVFHVVNPSGEPFTVHLRWREADRAHVDRPMLVRVFDPEERMLIRHDAPGEKSDDIEQTASLAVPARGAGVYQVAITGFWPVVDLHTDPPLSFGVYGYPQIACRDGQFAGAFVYAPPGLAHLNVRWSEGLQSLSVSDDAGSNVMKVSAADGSASSAPIESGRVYRLSARSQGVGAISFAGMPIVLCPDEASARAIHASVDVLDDGTICFHKFQARAHAILARYRALPPSAYAVQPPVLVRFRQEWLAQPARNQLLLGPYGVFAGLEAVLAAQVLDSASPWFGCIHAERDQSGAMRRGDPWKTIDRLGMSRVATTLPTLAAVYSVRERFNPLAGNEALRNRVVIAALQELMLLREHELTIPEFEEYPGGARAFTFTRLTFSFPLVVRDCPDDVRSVWTEGLQRCVDHEALGQVGITANQWSFIMRGIQQFSEGVDDDWYAQIVKRQVRWLLTRNQWGWGWMPAGYFAESGPDATYSGISLHNFGWLYRRTGDPDLKEALIQCFDLFNHTVAPEPDGSWLGATSFNSRTPDDWSKPQWTAGVCMLAGEIEEAVPLVGRAWLSQAPPVGAARLREAEQRTASLLTYLDRPAFQRIEEAVLMDASEIGFVVWQCSADSTLHGRLPVLESASFTRVFGQEFMCARRPGYYAFLYAGAPMEDWQKRTRPADPHSQFPRNGGGLCMFWSPAFGTSLLAKNWSAYAAQTVLVERADGADWEDYWSVQGRFDAVRDQATITATILNQPVQVERRINFRDDGVDCAVGLSVRAALNATGVWECFPYSLQKPGGMDLSLLDARGQPVRDAGLASAICFRAAGPQGQREVHLVVFSQPRRCRMGVERSIDNYKTPREHGYVLAEVPNATIAGDVEVRWTMLATPEDEIARQVAGAIARLRR